MGRKRNAKSHNKTQMIPKKKGKLLQTGFLNGLDVLKAITVTTY